MKHFVPKANMMDFLSIFDWVVFILLIAATFGMSYFFVRYKQKQSKDSWLDYLLMGRQLTLPLFVMTLVATWYGGIFGVTEITFKHGIYNFITQGVFWYITYIIFAIFLVDKLVKINVISLPELVEKEIGPKSARLSSYFNFMNVVPVAYVIGVGLFLKTLFGGSFLLMSIIGLIFVLLYSLKGGFRSVVATDIIQFFLMCSAVVIVLVFSIIEFSGFSILFEKLPAAHFSLTGGVGIGETMAWGFIALSTLIDPNFYQRCFAAKNGKVAKKGIFISTAIWFCFDLAVTIGALYARAVLPEADSKLAYLYYGVQLLPVGLKGLFLAGILATVLSTLDSYLFLGGMTFSYDILGKKKGSKVKDHALSVLFTAFIALILAQVFDGSIKAVWKTLGSYSAGCLLLPLGLKLLFSYNIPDKVFFNSCIISLVSITLWKLKALFNIATLIDELYIGVITSLLVLIFYKLKGEKLHANP